ncbi:Coq4 family protein [Pleurocapsa sp. FMAR1]|uniref:Coq4 family protein n=1 Tax=Pleurocapsa sp. FMAR1 TaxID=3040204 RepID=UPI0029C7C73C|nr:Coq4 family protein [Pleurocapsa sp. FMAR1]
MATFRRFIKAIKDYYQQGEAGDIAYLKIELLRIGGSPELLAKLEDLEDYYPTVNLEELAQLPEGTLGYEYAQHMKKNGIHPLKISDDLIEAAKANPFALRFTATHDIFHILLGFDTSYAGEIGVLGFTIGQDYSKFLNAYEPIIKHLYPLILRSQARQIRANLAKGKAIGEQAQCLLAYPFELNWSRPIEDIRAELGLVLDNQQLDAESINPTKDRSREIATA